MPSLRTPAIPYFLAGVAVGVFVDRILGGPAGNAGLASVVAAVAAAFALAGPLLQERMRQDSENLLILREDRKEHAVEIADTTLISLGGMWFAPDTNTWAPSPLVASGLMVNLAQGAGVGVERLQYWRYAKAHLDADPEAGPAWSELSGLLESRAKLKSELDELADRSLRGSIERAFGPGFVPRRGWATPQPRRMYDPGLILARLRAATDSGSFKIETSNYNYGPEIPPESRTRITYGPEEFLSTSESGVLDLPRFVALYTSLRTEPEFRSRLTDVEALDARLVDRTRQFAGLAWLLYERAKGSKQLPGACELCAEFAESALPKRGI